VTVNDGYTFCGKRARYSCSSAFRRRASSRQCAERIPCVRALCEAICFLDSVRGPVELSHGRQRRITDTNGQHVALHGHLTACGSRLLAFGEHGSID
jgi:hypothetical protein